MEKKNEMKVFTFAEKNAPIRVQVKNNETWFVAKDVCRALGIVNNRDAMNILDIDEKGVGNIDTVGGNQEVRVINESGLYHLIFVSRKAEAKKFRKWVTGEVLPQIRKTGRYEPQGRKVSLLLNQKYLEIASEARKWIHPEDVEQAAHERGCTEKHVREVLGGRKVSMPIMGILVKLAFGRKQSGDRWLSDAEREAAQLSLWGETLMA